MMMLNAVAINGALFVDTSIVAYLQIAHSALSIVVIDSAVKCDAILSTVSNHNIAQSNSLSKALALANSSSSMTSVFFGSATASTSISIDTLQNTLIDAVSAVSPTAISITSTSTEYPVKSWGPAPDYRTLIITHNNRVERLL